jgi:hypothetical protein
MRATLENKSKDGSEVTSRVKFNVGGQIYEISRDIVMSHPGTMLARIASETWQKDPTETIFINGDGERFRYVLDYLRTGSIFLPLTVPKPAVLKDLEWCSANFEAATHMSKVDAQVTKNVRTLMLEAAYSSLSYECCKCYSNGGAKGGDILKFCVATSGYQYDKKKILLDEFEFAFHQKLDRKHFNKRRAEYGLYYIEDGYGSASGTAWVQVGILSKRKKSG